MLFLLCVLATCNWTWDIVDVSNLHTYLIGKQLAALDQSVSCVIVYSTAYRKLSCRRETARRVVSLNISLRNSRSLKVIRNDTFE